MKIKYLHIDDASLHRVYDTEHSLRKLKQTCFYAGQTQEEYDEQELRKFAADKERGIILEYEVIK